MLARSQVSTSVCIRLDSYPYVASFSRVATVVKLSSSVANKGGPAHNVVIHHRPIFGAEHVPGMLVYSLRSRGRPRRHSLMKIVPAPRFESGQNNYNHL